MRRWLSLLALCSTCVLAPAHVLSQGREQEDARQLFLDGVGHARSGQWELALSAFEAAYKLATKPAVLFNLASTQLRCGKLLAGAANYRRFLASGDPLVTPQLRRMAEQQIARAEQRIPRLRIEIEGLREGDRILLDQVRLYPDELGREMWVDPGVHRVHVDRPQGDQEVHTIAVAEREVRVLAFRLP